MTDFTQSWRRLVAALKLPSAQSADIRRRLESLEQKNQALGAEHQAVAGKLDLLRAEVERRAVEFARELGDFGQGLRRARDERAAADTRLAELARALAAAEGRGETERARLATLEASLAETSERLETRCNQLKFLQDSERGQLQALKSALAEASSRLETRDDGLRKLLDAAAERVTAIETAQEEVAGRLLALDHGLDQLRSTSTEQSLQAEADRAATGTQLRATGNMVRALEKRFEADHGEWRAAIEEMHSFRQIQSVRTRLFLVGILVALALIVLILFWSGR